MLCSLRLDIVHINEGWAWRIFHRQEGMNQSLSSPIPFNSDVSPVEIFNGFISASANNNVNELKDYGKWMWKKLFVDSISGYLESFTSGDILFAVPKEWADICWVSLFFSSLSA